MFDEKANEVREDAIVKRMMKVSGTAVIVLGGAHHLSDNVPEGVKHRVDGEGLPRRVIADPEGTGSCWKIDATPTFDPHPRPL